METLSDVRVGWEGTLRLLVIEPWEASYLVGDTTCALRMFVAPTFPTLPQFSVVNVRVVVMKNGLRAVELMGAVEENGNLRALESCGAIVFSQSTQRFLMIRNYHTNAFIDVQFKLKAAFEGRIPSFSHEAMLLSVASWSDDELKWIIEWQLQKIWPYVTAERIKSWTAAMRRLDPSIKALYRGCKQELAARAGRGAHVVNSCWGIPKGGCKVVRGRLETGREAAARELHEETGLALGDADMYTADIPREHGRTFDRWFVHAAAGEAGAAPGAWDVAAVQWFTRADIAGMPHMARFGACLARAAGENQEHECPANGKAPAEPSPPCELADAGTTTAPPVCVAGPDTTSTTAATTTMNGGTGDSVPK